MTQCAWYQTERELFPLWQSCMWPSTQTLSPKYLVVATMSPVQTGREEIPSQCHSKVDQSCSLLHLKLPLSVKAKQILMWHERSAEQLPVCTVCSTFLFVSLSLHCSTTRTHCPSEETHLMWLMLLKPHTIYTECSVPSLTLVLC